MDDILSDADSISLVPAAYSLVRTVGVSTGDKGICG